MEDEERFKLKATLYSCYCCEGSNYMIPWHDLLDQDHGQVWDQDDLAFLFWCHLIAWWWSNTVCLKTFCLKDWNVWVFCHLCSLLPLFILSPCLGSQLWNVLSGDNNGGLFDFYRILDLITSNSAPKLCEALKLKYTCWN